MVQDLYSELPKNFDPEAYGTAYPDVGLSGLDPRTHYLKIGRALGRAPLPSPEATPTTANERHPAILDLMYAAGVIPSDTPVRHAELVSIIMPSYNNEDWIVRAIHSGLSQRGIKVEIIVVDDGSTDGSVAAARKIEQVQPNLRVISLLRNFGCYYARNIGLREAKGEFIAILDSDDIMAPDRLVRQMDVLKANPSAKGCRCQQRRWTKDFTAPLNSLRDGENSLLWRREIVDVVGHYDSVRYSGDVEFRMRVQRTFGADSIVNIPAELYYLRTLETSLTAQPASRIFEVKKDKIEVNISASRQGYFERFTDWQKQNKPSSLGEFDGMSIPFPLFSRDFALGATEQNASPHLGQRRVGAMASFPPRLESLKKTVERILPQLDELVLYLNDYDEVPDFARHPKIRAILGRESVGDLRDNGKFYDLPSDDCSYVLTFDDDLLYPTDYVPRMIHAIEMLGRNSIVGVHGVIFPEDEFTHVNQREVLHFAYQHKGQFVDLLGTGTTAWHSSIFKPALDEFETKGVCDLWFAAAAARREIPLYSIPRDQSWLKEQVRYEKSLYREALDRPEGYFQVYNGSIRHELEGGRIRRGAMAHLARGYDSDTLTAAGVNSDAIAAYSYDAPVKSRRSFDVCSPQRRTFTDLVRTRSEDISFHIVVNGWNCRSYLPDCLRSIAEQRPGRYRYEVTLIDDGSDDGTFEDLVRTPLLPEAHIVRISKNAGPAHARHVGIKAIENPDTVIVLIDMDDAIEPHALRTVEQCYRDNPSCLMTIGNWRDQSGVINPQPFYSAEEIDGQRVRDVEMFNATHLRTFRRCLYDAVEPADFLDQEGKWLETCTDVALMYPLLDQCWSNEVTFVKEPIYRYNRKHGQGTLARFGKPHKVERLNWLKSKPPKPRLHPIRTTSPEER